MRRREFIAGLGGAVAWPVAVRAQQVMPAIGYLDFISTNPIVPPAFREGLAAAGFVEGRNVTIEARFARNQEGRLAQFAAELVQRQVSVIVAIDSSTAVLAAKAATSTIPIVFMLPTDPIKFGVVTTLSRPGGNMTGVTVLHTELTAKRLDMLLVMAPSAATVAYLTNPEARNSEEATREMLEAARALGREAIILETRDALDIDAAFASLGERRAGALVVGPFTLFIRNRQKTIEMAARHKIPAIYPYPGFVRSGGLMSYTADLMAPVRQIGSLYVAQILRGAKPADLPVQQPTKFELVLNLKTAKALGLEVPPTLLALADEVIE
jgi:putative tryptophan/tyrosine transport system substrate-binding protein